MRAPYATCFGMVFLTLRKESITADAQVSISQRKTTFANLSRSGVAAGTHDQWISLSGTAVATKALTFAGR